jgi:hypothetical protein
MRGFLTFSLKSALVYGIIYISVAPPGRPFDNSRCPGISAVAEARTPVFDRLPAYEWGIGRSPYRTTAELRHLRRLPAQAAGELVGGVPVTTCLPRCEETPDGVIASAEPKGKLRQTNPICGSPSGTSGLLGNLSHGRDAPATGAGTQLCKTNPIRWGQMRKTNPICHGRPGMGAGGRGWEAPPASDGAKRTQFRASDSRGNYFAGRHLW